MELRATWIWVLVVAATPVFAANPPDAGSFDETVTLLQQHFWKELSREEIEHEAIKALLEKLDPYGKFLDVESRKAFEGYLAATTTGIGVDIFIDDTVHLPRVRHLLLGGGAGAAGVRAGDWILSIDGRTCEGQSMDEVLPRLRGAGQQRLDFRAASGGRQAAEHHRGAQDVRDSQCARRAARRVGPARVRAAG